MRKTQGIFRAVIRAGYYGPDQDRDQSPYMCNALQRAEGARLITPEEMERAKGSIQRYMRRLEPDIHVLRLALNYGAGQDYSPYTWEHGAGRDFYWDWDKRPRFTKD